MTNPQPMLSVSEARARILEHFSPLPAETVPLAAAARRVLAADLAAPHDLPPFANSSMDGYAVRSAEAVPGASLPVSADVPAGAGLPAPLAVGTAARIMTGAALPSGADAVVPVEDTDDRRERPGEPPPARVTINTAPVAGANVRPVGQDLRAGQPVLAAGAPLGPSALGLLAALGYAQVPVYRRPSVAVFSTGDELRPVDVPLGPGQIHDTNGYTLAAAIEQYGGQALRLGIVGDQLAAVRAALLAAKEHGADLILSSAGVSVGAYDVVKAAIELDGVLNFWRVRMRPGKPLAFGHVHGVPYFGLPGNPVSALMTFEVFARPALLKLAGRRHWDKLAVHAALADPLESDGRETYLRVVVARWPGGGYVARTAGNQGSAVLSALARANGLLILPEGVTRAQPGDQFTVWLLDGGETILDADP
ncbi:MAG: molybdopterin molybdotransferase MoeA [Anaerolineales bacterium]|nr:molybdopterin molybdotransferase MoeA [Anaerolineales bacterium]